MQCTLYIVSGYMSLATKQLLSVMNAELNAMHDCAVRVKLHQCYVSCLSATQSKIVCDEYACYLAS